MVLCRVERLDPLRQSLGFVQTSAEKTGSL